MHGSQSSTPPGPSGLRADAVPVDRPDLASLRERFARDGRVVVPDVLDAGFARELRTCIETWTRWALVTRIDGAHRDFDAAAIAAMTPAQLQPLQALIAAETRHDMQYLYERFPLHDIDYDPGALPGGLARFRDLLRGGPFIAMTRAISGCEDIAFGDAQVTRYRAGHFLTRHDDAHAHKQRRVAYVLGLSEGWRPDDGGQLQFLDEQDRVDHVVVPQFNTLTLFRVPRPHLVTAVSPFTDNARLSITGWLRAV